MKTETQTQTLSQCIAKNLKMFRINRGLTQKDIATASCYSISSIRKIENNERAINFDALQRIANNYNCKIEDFLKTV